MFKTFVLISSLLAGAFFATFDTVHASRHEKKEREPVCSPTSTPIPTPTITPLPTVTPESTPSATPVPSTSSSLEVNGSGSMPHASTCGVNAVSIPPQNAHLIRNANKADIKWVPSVGEEVNVYYKLNSSNNWQYSVRDEKNDGFVVIGNLNPNKGYTFGIQQKNGCGGGIIAIIVDPPAKGKIFRVSRYE